MGSPLGPLFANVYMSNFEHELAEQLKQLGVTNWFRYVDDIFATLSDPSKINEILALLNSKATFIKFTIEHEKNNRLSFLDTTVYKGLTTFHTTMYRKPTFTGVYLHWTSLTSRRYKIALIYSLLNRTWKICSEENERNNELATLKEILLRNEYPEHVIDQEFKKFIKSRTGESIEQNSDNVTNVDENNNEVDVDENNNEKTVEKLVTDKRFIVLPYVSKKADEFATRLKRLVTSTYPTVEFNVAFKAPNEIGRYFPFKDKIKRKGDRSSVIYKINCTHPDCQASYIGMTRRHLKARVYEHRTRQTAVHEHELSTGHKMGYDDTEIIDTSDSLVKLAAKEALHILQKRPTLNKQLNSQQSFDLKMLIIGAQSSQC